jgi:hypothetical protein
MTTIEEQVAKETVGLTAAQIRKLADEARNDANAQLRRAELLSNLAGLHEIDAATIHLTHEQRQLALAHHEAAHAVVGYALGLHVIEATILERAHSELSEYHSQGSVTFERSVAEDDDGNNLCSDWLMGEAISLAISDVAGIAAEMTFLDSRSHSIGYLSDTEHFDERCWQICVSGEGLPHQRLMEWLSAEANALVVIHAASIRAVASALLEHKTLSGADIGRIIGEVHGHPSAPKPPTSKAG